MRIVFGGTLGDLPAHNCPRCGKVLQWEIKHQLGVLDKPWPELYYIARLYCEVLDPATGAAPWVCPRNECQLRLLCASAVQAPRISRCMHRRRTQRRSPVKNVKSSCLDTAQARSASSLSIRVVILLSVAEKSRVVCTEKGDCCSCFDCEENSPWAIQHRCVQVYTPKRSGVLIVSFSLHGDFLRLRCNRLFSPCHVHSYECVVPKTCRASNCMPDCERCRGMRHHDSVTRLLLPTCADCLAATNCSEWMRVMWWVSRHRRQEVLRQPWRLHCIDSRSPPPSNCSSCVRSRPCLAYLWAI